MLFASIPFAIMHRGQIPLWNEIRRRDAAFYERLGNPDWSSTLAPTNPGFR